MWSHFMRVGGLGALKVTRVAWKDHKDCAIMVM